ncbi:hypothetical protein [Paenibacillus sp. 2003]|uniref:hypothetical protein n=1 Tax=Paenibacillus TaxID=44249 RepID=UPI002865D5F3|nr:hypothetical protein [Paenibacillus sp. 2003]MDR6716419.1 CubicO group peptidase (beta-lactamase class C family) [Paenibacillus sp. 2003]
MSSQDSQGIAIGGFGLRMKFEDMLKFGVLYAQNGEWNSKQLIKDAENKTFYAMGMGGGRGQYIFVNQDRGLVAVFTTIISDNSLLPLQWFNNYILKE